MRSPLSTSTEREWASFFCQRSVVTSSRTRTVAQVVSLSQTIHGHLHVVSPLACSPVSALSCLLELPTELDNPIVMESLRNYAENESEDTLNAFTSPTLDTGSTSEIFGHEAASAQEGSGRGVDEGVRKH